MIERRRPGMDRREADRCKVCSIAGPRLAEDPAHVVPHRLVVQTDEFRDPPIRVTSGDHLHDSTVDFVRNPNLVCHHLNAVSVSGKGLDNCLESLTDGTNHVSGTVIEHSTELARRLGTSSMNSRPTIKTSMGSVAGTGRDSPEKRAMSRTVPGTLSAAT